MSYLDKLSIGGIRSFDPQHHQMIKFLTPLTIILGPNGAGKTSIIESLRYVTTGEHPPYSNRGKTFVHDPTYANVVAVKGQLKLKFTDVGGQSVTATRSLEATVKKSAGRMTLSVKTLNSHLNRADRDIDSRCIDFDNEMLELFGVSKAVITNVVFCHQEESNWPLSEGKVLKEKFDDIFGSIGYVKALEKIKKLRNDEKNKEKLCHVQLQALEEFKKQSDDKIQMRKTLETRLATYKDDINEYEKKLSKIRGELNEIIAKENTVQEIQNKISQYEGMIHEKKKMYDDIKKNITNVFRGNKEDLSMEIVDFEANFEFHKQKKNEITIKLNDSKKMYDKCIQSQQTISKELGKLEHSKEVYDNLLLERQDLVINMCKESNIEIDSFQEINDSKINDIEELIRNHIEELKDELNRVERDNNNKENVITQEYDTLKEHMNKSQHELQLRINDYDEKKRMFNDIERQICNIDLSQDRYTEICKDIDMVNAELKKLRQSIDVQKLRVLISEQNSEKNRLRIDINDYDDKLKKFNEEKEQRVKYDMNKKNRDAKMEKFNKLIENHKDIMKKVGISGDSGGFHKALENLIRALNNRIESYDKIISSKRENISRYNTTIDMKRDSIKKMKYQIEECEREKFKHCGNNDFSDVFNRSDNELKVLRENCSDLGSSKKFYVRQIELINKNKYCPVCEHTLNGEWINSNGETINQSQLIKKLQNNTNPMIIEEKIKKLKEKEKFHEILVKLKPKIESVQKFKDEIENLEKEIESINEKVNVDNNDMSKSNEELEMKKTEVESLRNVLRDASDYDTCVNDIRTYNREINRIELYLNSDTSICEEEIIETLKTKKDRFNELDTEIGKNQNAEKTFIEKSNKLERSLMNFENDKLKIERDQQNRVNIEKQRNDMRSQLENIDLEIKNLKIVIAEHKPKMDDIEIRKINVMRESKDKENEINYKINYKNDKFNEIMRKTKEIYKINESGVLKKLIELRNEMIKVQNEVKTIEDENKTFTDHINKLTEDITTNELKKRELKDNLKLIEYDEDINDKKKLLKKEQEKLGFHNIGDLIKQKRVLESDERKLDNEKQRVIGKKDPIHDQIRDIEKELKKDIYKNAEKNFKEKLYERDVRSVAGDDLSKYYKALDYAVTNFHRRKMEEINKLIKGFWKNSYRGCDIDYIKITSDEEERSADKRRLNYNYRVVMVKGHSEMDMRGRCSAGQKVLACLIIRLALAEIFCANCSVLALDEPTTNLDKDNIESLARAITEIVRYRSKKKNSHFQLIIITHDEEFLSCLNEDTGNNYYTVFKDDNGYSKIVKKSKDHNDE